MKVPSMETSPPMLNFVNPHPPHGGRYLHGSPMT
jgi:hypothetical protein